MTFHPKMAYDATFHKSARQLVDEGPPFVPFVPFIPPAWQMGQSAREVLRASDFAYTSSRDELYTLPAFRSFKAPSLVYSSRSAWRRALSYLWNERRLARLRSEPLLRIALHPADASHPAVLRHWRRLLAALTAERSGILESRWLAAHAARD